MMMRLSHVKNSGFSAGWMWRVILGSVFFRVLGLLSLLLILVACSPNGQATQGVRDIASSPTTTSRPAAPTRTTPATALPQPAVQVTRSPVGVLPQPRVADTQPALLTPTPAVTFTPTPDVYAGLGIEALASRAYGDGSVEIEGLMTENSYFTRNLFRYPSDGLTIYGFANVPKKAPQGESGKYPVVIALHGYIDPAIYQTLDYTTGYADALARAGYIVLHPNLRGYRPSDEGDNRFRVGMAIDVLNLIALVKQHAGLPGLLENADPQAIGLWGHSMGGGITTRVITVSPDVKAAVLYGAMSADDQKNYERIYSYFSNGTRGLEELQAPPEAFQRISAINFLERIQAAVSIHHGKNDADVPLAWSLDLCTQLGKLEKIVECFTYEDQAHTFHDEGNDLFIQRMIDFFDRTLKVK